MAVYTNVSADEISAFIAEYDVGEVVSFQGIAEGIENSNYLLSTTRDKFILTIYENRLNAEELPFFLGLMEHLAHKGMNCAVPIADRNGIVLKEICAKPVALISFLDGLSIEQFDVQNCRQAGAAVAEMHLAAADFTLSRTNHLSLDGWQKLAISGAGQADDCMSGLGEIIQNEMIFLSDNWPDNLPVGIIHADLFPDNIFFLGGDVSGIIDYYFACTDMLIYDVAICINAWCFEADGSFNTAKIAAIIKGYNKIRPLSDDEIKALPILCRGAAMRFLLTRLYDWFNRVEGAIVKTKDPLEYLTKLKFHQNVKNVSQYGLDENS